MDSWLSEMEKLRIEKNLGPICAREAGERTTNDEGQSTEDYLHCYRSLFDTIMGIGTDRKRSVFFERALEYLDHLGEKCACKIRRKFKRDQLGQAEEQEFVRFVGSLPKHPLKPNFEDLLVADDDFLQECLSAIVPGRGRKRVREQALGLIKQQGFSPGEPESISARLGPFWISEDDFGELNKAFGLLCHDAAWKVVKSYRTEEEEHIAQELFIALLRSAYQYRRKCYFLKCFDYLQNLGLDRSPLVVCWESNFRKHRLIPEEEANFLEFMESLPEDPRKPDTRDPLILDEGAARYIKTCIWNQQKAHLKGLGKERSQRKGEISLSEADNWFEIGLPVSTMQTNENSLKRDELFERIRVKLSEVDKRAHRTFEILTDPKNEREVFPRTSEYKLKINGVRKRTRQSYKSIRSDLVSIKEVISDELEVAKTREDD